MNSTLAAQIVAITVTTIATILAFGKFFFDALNKLSDKIDAQNNKLDNSLAQQRTECTQMFKENQRLWLDNQDKWVTVVRELTQIKSQIVKN